MNACIYDNYIVDVQLLSKLKYFISGKKKNSFGVETTRKTNNLYIVYTL